MARATNVLILGMLILGALTWGVVALFSHNEEPFDGGASARQAGERG
jgi:hypothetical protein